MFEEKHYEATVNQEDVNMRRFTDELNDRWKDGWRLAHVFVHNQSNTITVWERRESAAGENRAG